VQRPVGYGMRGDERHARHARHARHSSVTSDWRLVRTRTMSIMAPRRRVALSSQVDRDTADRSHDYLGGVCVESLFLRSPGQAPYWLDRRAPKGGLPGTPPRSPPSRIHRCRGGLYRGSIAQVWLGPELFPGIGVTVFEIGGLRLDR
jgi:hypothetical protein